MWGPSLFAVFTHDHLCSSPFLVPKKDINLFSGAYRALKYRVRPIFLAKILRPDMLNFEHAFGWCRTVIRLRLSTLTPVTNRAHRSFERRKKGVGFECAGFQRRNPSEFAEYPSLFCHLPLYRRAFSGGRRQTHFWVYVRFAPKFHVFSP
jgi:hypothetical protein